MPSPGDRDKDKQNRIVPALRKPLSSRGRETIDFSFPLDRNSLWAVAGVIKD